MLRHVIGYAVSHRGVFAALASVLMLYGGYVATQGRLEEAEANGRDVRTGGLRRAVVSAQEAREALETPVMQVIDAVRETLEQTPPELSADISERGIVLAGGGVLLRGFPERLRAETGLPVHLAQEPLTCVALGAGRCLDDLGEYSLDKIARFVARESHFLEHRLAQIGTRDSPAFQSGTLPSPS